MDESQIVAGCRRQERAAQRGLYELTHERIHRLLLRMVHNPEDAADLLQETYIRAFARIGQFQQEAGIATWLYRVAVNEALQFLRSRKRRERGLQSDSAADPGRQDPGPMGVDMRDALDRLPEFERTLLILKYYQNMNYAEMADVLEKPSGTIASGLNRARELLRGVLGEVTIPQPSAEEVGSGRHLKE